VVTIGSYTGRKPEMIDVSGDAGNVNVIQDITWTTWGPATASGRGTSNVDDCVPTCAQGATTPVTTEVTLSNPVEGRFSDMRETRQGAAVFMTFRSQDWPLNASQTWAPVCPTSDQLMTAWRAAPAGSRQGWAASENSVTSFDNIQCWNDWVVGGVVGSGNGAFVFSQTGGLHLFPESDLQQFDDSVCPDAQAPVAWKNPASGPASC
jgi:hypothetical protein